MAGKVLNKDKYEKAIKEYQESEYISITELAKKYNFDRASFSRYLKKNNIPIRKTLSEKHKTYLKAKNEYESTGCTLKYICEKYKINQKNFSLFLKDNNVTVRKGFENKHYTKDENYFEIIDSEEKAYWLGFIFADGCVVNNSSDGTYRLCIELSNADKEHLEKFKRSIKSDSPIVSRKNRDTSSITINSKKIVDDLMNLGAVVDKTNKGFISKRILELNKNLKLAFLRGYLDGDGYIDKTRYRIIYTVKSSTITNSLNDMLKEYNPKIKDDITYFRILIENKDNYNKFLDDIYGNANIYLNRKYNTYTKRCAVLG